MEQAPKTTEKIEGKELLTDMEKFQAEIKELKKKNRNHYELSRIKPEKLTEEDARMWKKYKDKTITPEEIAFGSAYYKDIEKDIKNSNYGSRENFIAFLRQKLPQLIEQQIKHENSLNGNLNK